MYDFGFQEYAMWNAEDSLVSANTAISIFKFNILGGGFESPYTEM
jgi:hypothetical protein